MTQKIYGGCDVGSTTGKAVLLRERSGSGGEAVADVVATALRPSQVDPEATAREVLGLACAEVPGLGGVERLAGLIGTGYGRNEVPFADRNVSEITCHAVGAHACAPGLRTLVDVGGQDVKAIALNDDGTVREFAMNDKCAAGTGRFFEAMSRVFRMELPEFSRLSLDARRAVAVSSQCSVFAETEVISLLAGRHRAPDVAAGVQMAVAKRVFSLARRVGVRPELAVTGGCAKNDGLCAALARLFRLPLTPLPVDPQLVGALGAAVLARRVGAG